MNSPQPTTIEKGIYRHNKTGNLYEVLGVALQTETYEFLVIYRAFEPDPKKQYHYELFARPYAMFVEKVALGGVLQPRFDIIKP